MADVNNPPVTNGHTNGGDVNGGEKFGGGGGGGTIVPVQGQIVAEQRSGVGRFSRNLVPFSYAIDAARSADDPKEERIPGHALQVLVAQGGVVPDDARISIGGSKYFPVVEGWVYEAEEPFDGFSIYWPTAAAAGTRLWIIVGFGRPLLFRRP